MRWVVWLDGFRGWVHAGSPDVARRLAVAAVGDSRAAAIPDPQKPEEKARLARIRAGRENWPIGSK